jgi:hypothetical protein
MRGMDGDTRYSIGDLARRTGLSVRTIRFYSDCGVLPPADRSPAGYRRYGPEALARLDLILDLPLGGGHRGYAAVVDGSGLMVACCCSHSMGGR